MSNFEARSMADEEAREATRPSAQYQMPPQGHAPQDLQRGRPPSSGPASEVLQSWPSSGNTDFNIQMQPQSQTQLYPTQIPQAWNAASMPRQTPPSHMWNDSNPYLNNNQDLPILPSAAEFQQPYAANYLSGYPVQRFGNNQASGQAGQFRQPQQNTSNGFEPYQNFVAPQFQGGQFQMQSPALPSSYNRHPGRMQPQRQGTFLMNTTLGAETLARFVREHAVSQTHAQNNDFATQRGRAGMDPYSGQNMNFSVPQASPAVQSLQGGSTASSVVNQPARLSAMSTQYPQAGTAPRAYGTASHYSPFVPGGQMNWADRSLAAYQEFPVDSGTDYNMQSTPSNLQVSNNRSMMSRAQGLLAAESAFPEPFYGATTPHSDMPDYWQSGSLQGNQNTTTAMSILGNQVAADPSLYNAGNNGLPSYLMGDNFPSRQSAVSNTSMSNNGLAGNYGIPRPLYTHSNTPAQPMSRIGTAPRAVHQSSEFGLAGMQQNVLGQGVKQVPHDYLGSIHAQLAGQPQARMRPFAPANSFANTKPKHFPALEGPGPRQDSNVFDQATRAGYTANVHDTVVHPGQNSGDNHAPVTASHGLATQNSGSGLDATQKARTRKPTTRAKAMPRKTQISDNGDHKQKRVKRSSQQAPSQEIELRPIAEAVRESMHGQSCGEPSTDDVWNSLFSSGSRGKKDTSVEQTGVVPNDTVASNPVAAIANNPTAGAPATPQISHNLDSMPVAYGTVIDLTSSESTSPAAVQTPHLPHLPIMDSSGSINNPFLCHPSERNTPEGRRAVTERILTAARVLNPSSLPSANYVPSRLNDLADFPNRQLFPRASDNAPPAEPPEHHSGETQHQQPDTETKTQDSSLTTPGYTPGVLEGNVVNDVVAEETAQSNAELGSSTLNADGPEPVLKEDSGAGNADAGADGNCGTNQSSDLDVSAYISYTTGGATMEDQFTAELDDELDKELFGEDFYEPFAPENLNQLVTAPDDDDGEPSMPVADDATGPALAPDDNDF